MVQSYRELIIWQKGMMLAKEIYTLCDKIPTDEKFGLISQLQRAAVAIPSNIAEGYQRGTKEYIQFLTIAAGSLSEVETQLLLVHEVYKVDTQPQLNMCEELSKLLRVIRKRLHTKPLTLSAKPSEKGEL